jgi:hypothetical protein
MTEEEKDRVDSLEFYPESTHRDSAYCSCKTCQPDRFGCWVYGDAFPRFVHEALSTENPDGEIFGGTSGNDSGVRCAGPSEIELEQIFAYMRQHDIPAYEPEDWQLLLRLGNAGVRIIDGA